MVVLVRSRSLTSSVISSNREKSFFATVRCIQTAPLPIDPTRNSLSEEFVVFFGLLRITFFIEFDHFDKLNFVGLFIGEN